METECIDDLTLEEAKQKLDDLLLQVKLTDLNDFGTYLVSKAVEARQAAKGIHTDCARSAIDTDPSSTNSRKAFIITPACHQYC